MVVNAMMVAMAAHSEEQAQRIFHLTSSLRNPAPYAILAESAHRYFLQNPPRSEKNGEPVRLSRMRFFRTLPGFRAYMAVRFRLPLEVRSLVAHCSLQLQVFNTMNCDQFDVDSAHEASLITECSLVLHGLGHQILGLLNIAGCGAFSRRYHELSRKYRYVMHIAELYAPYALFKGR
jgi:fatty acyl-CoA reductase